MSHYLLISDAAKEVKVESHVLRYWEEELNLPINRNELGHRYYTEEDVERFKQIKSMKERGLQLKAIKMILKDGKLSVMPEKEGNAGIGNAGIGNSGIGSEVGNQKEETQGGFRQSAGETFERNGLNERDISVRDGRYAEENPGRNDRYVDMRSEQNKTEESGGNGGLAINIVNSRKCEGEALSDRRGSGQSSREMSSETREEKARRLQWLLQQLIRETLQENNQELCRDIKESVVKELDYQFRMQEEREEERERRNTERGEAYYKKMDELLRKKSRRFVKEEPAAAEKKEKKKRHSLF